MSAKREFNGPLVMAVSVVKTGVGGAYGRDKYKLACNHEVWGAKGAARVRCWKCRVEADVKALASPEPQP